LQTTHVTPAQISFNDTFTTDYKMQNLTITNGGPDNVSYRLFNNVSVSIAPYNRSAPDYAFVQPAITSFDSPSAIITFSASEVHLRPGQRQTIQVSVQLPNTNSLDHITYGGFIQFDPIISQQQKQIKAVHVPYFGIVGSQRDLPVIDQKFNMTVSNNATNITYGIHDTIIYDFTLNDEEDEDYPMSLLINFKLESPTLIVKGEVLEKDKLLGYAFQPITYLERDFINNTNARDPLVWNGQYFKSIPYDVFGFSEENIPKIPQDQFISVPIGNYSLRVSALKQFGNVDNVNDWDSFIVGPIVLTREVKEEEGNKED
jgi:hypothetical protein